MHWRYPTTIAPRTSFNSMRAKLSIGVSSTYVLGWLDAMPEELIRSRPMLCVIYAYSAMNNLEKRNHWIEAAQASLVAWPQGAGLPGAEPDLYDMVFRHVATLRAIPARARGEASEKVIKLIETALKVVPESDPGTRSILVGNLGIEYLNSGDEQAAERALIDAGSKALTSDLLGLTGYGCVRALDGARVYDHSEEHGFLDVSRLNDKPRVGDLVRVTPNHVCPVSNLYDKVVFIRGSSVLGCAGAGQDAASDHQPPEQASVAVLNMPDVKKILFASGLDAAPGTPEAFGAYIKSEKDKWEKVIKAAGLYQTN